MVLVFHYQKYIYLAWWHAFISLKIIFIRQIKIKLGFVFFWGFLLVLFLCVPHARDQT